MFAVSKASDLNWLVQGGQWYWAFPFSKGSLSEANLIMRPWNGVLSTFHPTLRDVYSVEQNYIITDKFGRFRQ
jgi:hypothetical protein